MSARSGKVGFWTSLAVLAGAMAFGPGLVRGDGSEQDKAEGTREARVRSVDDLLAAVADRLPAFGGMFVDEEQDVLYVYSEDLSSAAGPLAEEAVTAVFGDKRPARRIQVLPARYGFRDLKEWHDRLTPEVLGMPGVVMTDIDDRSNRLTVGVESLESKGGIEDKLFALGVPLEAVNIVETPPVEMEVLTTLRNRFRPIAGGQQISFRRGTSTLICTEGFNAVRAGVAGYVTNSHCTAVQGGVNGTVHSQATIDLFGFNRIGVETVDPVYFVGAPCPAGRRCRRSDSSFARRLAGVTASQGRIARTALNSINWNTANTFRIVREANALVGQFVTKVGRTTGRTSGVVQLTCANFNVLGTNITQLCQSKASYLSAAGDSGSPVFRIVNFPAVNDVALVGIHWGSGGVFSPISNIQRSIFHAELGPLTTCAPGFVC
jgi:hypothetical protein